MTDQKQEMVKTDGNVPAAPTKPEVGHVAPRYEIIEGEQAFTVKLEMPGVSRETLEIQADHETLTVRGQRIESDESLTPIFIERPKAEYLREFSMDDTVDWEKISASVHDGIVSVDIPKASHAKPRRIAIT